ncbi:MAG: hypothetical protein ABI670_06735 [Chloroflexota bacterium]
MFKKGDQSRNYLLGGLLVLLSLALVTASGWLVRSQSTATGGSGPLGNTGVIMGAAGVSDSSTASAPAAVAGNAAIVVGTSYHNDVSPALRDMPAVPYTLRERKAENENPPIRIPGFVDAPDPVVQRSFAPIDSAVVAAPTPGLSFNGIGFPGVACNCAPPDTNGEVGATQYVQMVNEGYQVFDKTTGTSVFGPVSINTIWSGFSAPCNSGAGDPVVLYDQIANRWLISQFAGGSAITDECIAISTTSDATGSYNRYGFHLGSNFYDYPHLSVWPDGYYMSDNVFNAAGTTYLGPQPFVFDRAKMLAGQSATFQTTSAPLGGSVEPILPADLDGSTAPPAGAPDYFVGFGSPMPLYRFHVDWTTPANTTFANFANLTVAGFTQLCTTTRSCIPQPSTTAKLDAIADRPMFRLAYRNFGDHESMVTNHTVNVGGGQAGIRWYEIRIVNSSPSIYQQGSYAPDATHRWLGSAAMDKVGDIAIGYSASSTSVFPSLRYAGQIPSDPKGILGQGETTLFAGLGSQSGTGSRWGDYSDLTVDPIDDCTFWYTNEYYPAGATQYNWRTRIGSFQFPGCVSGPAPTATPASATATPAPATATPTRVPATATPTRVPATATPTRVPATATPTPTAGDFSLTVAPTSRTVPRNSSTTYAVSLTSLNGFAGSVTLSVTGLPSRATGTFSPNPVTLTSGGTGTSTFTVNVKRNVAPGTYTLTVRGVNGSLSHTQTVTLIIN